MQAALIVISLLAAEPGEVWPSFRGTGDSRTEAKNLPLRWSDENNIAWRTDLPGYGQSSPVAWKNSAFVTAVQGEFKERLLVLAVNISDGKIAWRKEFAASERIKDSNYVGKAAPTPVVDSERLFVFYESGDL
ncbi:MAG: PQQ-like beta-propeller repeat protein, partial [Planctomycetales bacterium]